MESLFNTWPSGSTLTSSQTTFVEGPDDDPFNIFTLPPSRSCSASNSPVKRPAAERNDEGWNKKQIILIRHARSCWNEFCGAHKEATWKEHEAKRKGFRSALRSIVGGRGSTSESPSDLMSHIDPEPNSAADKNQSGVAAGFWQGVRGGVKHVANALGHAGSLNQVDHPLSHGGLLQARALKNSIEKIAAEPQFGHSASSMLLQCRVWYVSPFSRALQTAAYALAPLYRLDPLLQMRVTPQANEIVNTSMSLDCQGKKGNVGFRVVARALSKLAETLEDDDEDPTNRAMILMRQGELKELTAVLCAMDLSEVAQVWWSDVGSFKKEHLRLEDDRVKRLVGRLLLEEDASCVGLVAHSLLFRRILQIFWPGDQGTQDELRSALRNGAYPDTPDPYSDKVMNCGTIVLTWRYRTDQGGLAAEVIKAEFLFDGHMEGALNAGLRDPEVPEAGFLPEEPELL